MLLGIGGSHTPLLWSTMNVMHWIPLREACRAATHLKAANPPPAKRGKEQLSDGSMQINVRSTVQRWHVWVVGYACCDAFHSVYISQDAHCIRKLNTSGSGSISLLTSCTSWLWNGQKAICSIVSNALRVMYALNRSPCWFGSETLAALALRLQQLNKSQAVAFTARHSALLWD